MSSSYEFFAKFPVIEYNDVYAIDLLRRIRTNTEFQKEALAYYSYSIKDGERPDNVVQNLYQSPFHDWVLFLVNQYNDPLFDWYKDQQTFENYIIGKYGSLDAALAKTAYYRVKQDLGKITLAQYNALTPNKRRYWTRSVTSEQGDQTFWRTEESARARLLAESTTYEVGKKDIVSDTNLIMKLTYTPVFTYEDEVIEVGDKVQQIISGTLVVSGEVAAKGPGNVIFVKHVFDTVFYDTEGVTSGFTGAELKIRNKNSTIQVQTATVKSQPIATDEYVYWEPLSFYDMEEEINASRRLITILARPYVQGIQDDAARLLRQ